MHVLLLAPHPFFQDRGTPIAERALVQVLTGQGHQVDLLTFHEGEDIDLPHCRIFRIPRVPGTDGIRPGFSVKKLVCDVVLVWQCARRLRRERYDVVHAVEESAFIALAMKWLFRVPYVFDMDSSMPQQMVDKFAFLRPVRRLMDATEAVAVRQSVGVVAVCKALEDTARRYAPHQTIARVEDISLLEHGAHCDEQLVDTLGFTGPVVMYVGNLEPYQGIELLLQSFRHTATGVPDAQLVIIGGAKDHIAHYTRMAGELGLAAHVHFAGQRPLAGLAGYLTQAAVLVSPRTQGQNTPMKVYSYLDSGRPLVATRLPTHTQVLDDTIACLAAPEPEAFGTAVADLLQDPERAAALAQQAALRVQAEFSAQAFERKVLAFYAVVERAVTGARTTATTGSV